MSERSGQATARAQIAAAALLFSTGGAAIKATALASWQVAGLRSAIAFGFLLLVLPAARRGWSLATLLVGVAYGGTMVLFVTANKLTTAANSIFLQATAPVWLLPLSRWLLREPIHRRNKLRHDDTATHVCQNRQPQNPNTVIHFLARKVRFKL